MAIVTQDVEAVVKAAQEIARMKSPSIAMILRKYGFEYEAQKVAGLVETLEMLKWEPGVPKCRCGQDCQWYGETGGYSVQCAACNERKAVKQRVAARERELRGAGAVKLKEPGLADGVYQVQTKRFTAAFEVRGGWVVKFAPILRRSLLYWVTLGKRVGE